MPSFQAVDGRDSEQLYSDTIYVMGFMLDFLAGKRKALPVNTPVPGGVPLERLTAFTRDALKLPIVRKCLGYLADNVNKAEPQIVDKDGKVLRTRRTLPSFLKSPSPEFSFKELIHQAVYAEFFEGEIKLLGQVANNGTPVALYVGDRTVVTQSTGEGMLYYWMHQYTNQGIQANRISIARRFSAPGTLQGLSEYASAETLISAALHCQEVVQKYFASNMHIDLMFTHEGEAPRGAVQELLKTLAEHHAGSRKAFRPVVTGRQWKMERLQESPQSAQLVELYQLINQSICTTVFGIDPLVFALGSGTTSGQNLTYQNASNLRSQVWLQAIEPVADLIADTITDYLPTGQFFEFSPRDLLRGSPHDRGQLVASMAAANQANTTATRQPIFSAEEIREPLGYFDPPPPKIMTQADVDSQFQEITDAF